MLCTLKHIITGAKYKPCLYVLCMYVVNVWPCLVYITTTSLHNRIQFSILSMSFIQHDFLLQLSWKLFITVTVFSFYLYLQIVDNNNEIQQLLGNINFQSKQKPQSILICWLTHVRYSIGKRQVKDQTRFVTNLKQHCI